MGKILLEQGNKVEAEEIYLKLIQLDSLNAYYHSQLGYSQFKLNKKEDAINSYNRSLEIDSLNTSTILQLSKIFFKDEEYRKAYDLISKGLSINALNLPLNRLGAEVLFKLQKYRAAAVQYDLLVKFGDTTATIYQKLGFCNYFVAEQLLMSDSTESKKKIYEAIYALEESRRLNWEDPLTSLYLGICFKELKDYSRAITYLQESLNLLYPDYISDVYVHLGVAYEQEKKYPESIAAYRKGLEHRPSNSALLFQLATVYDEYYADREVPLIYFKLFVKRGGEENPVLKNYAQSRISALIEEMHFRNGRSK
jgi:tetratricopeptide (TPR) repeat protein